MSKKIINVKYHPNVIGTMNSDELESITCDIKKLIGDDYVVIFSPFDFQEIPEEGMFETVEGALKELKQSRRDDIIIKLNELTGKFVPSEFEGESDSNCLPSYSEPEKSETMVIDCDA